ncbi:MAG: DNA polymerase III subunit gamma/tau [Candidatus Aceula meridiana]|nr:DNA polymerase III subunit gamma/tau [Candidatus Aceula meridiana]
MSYVVLARKYRPQTFDEVAGQNHITDLLKKSIQLKRLAHAYLFCGPRGIGKTSCARIFAKSLNCQDGPTATPCGKCSSCADVAKGTSFDVIEVDGASNRGIDEIRTLRENVKFAPTYGRYKVYIVDEVHMLTTEAFNALLKTLEEPPEHVKFIFATTEPNKVPATILSRCQRFDFKRISVKTTIESLSSVCKQEKFKIEPDALHAIAKASMGSLRDALSVLDQLSALSQQTIKTSDVTSMLGLVETQWLFDLTDSIAVKDCALGLQILDKILDQGKDVKQLFRNLVEHFRHLMVIKVGGKSLGRLVDYPVALKEMLLKQTESFTIQEILFAIDTLLKAQDDARIMDSLRICLEVALAKLTCQDKDILPKDVAEDAKTSSKISALEMIANKKGHLDFSSDAKPKEKNEKKEAQKIDPAILPEKMNIENIRKLWDSLTSAVSRKRMSLATYLQEGDPFEVSENKLTVSFPEEAVFHKETLDEKQNKDLIESILAERLRCKIRLEFCIVADQGKKEDEPHLKSTLEKFQGKVTHRWHRHKA